LGELDNAEAGRGVNIEVKGVSLDPLVADSLGGDTLKRVKVAGGIQDSLGIGLRNDGGRGNLVVGIIGGVPSNAGSSNSDSENGQSQEQRAPIQPLHRRGPRSLDQQKWMTEADENSVRLGTGYLHASSPQTGSSIDLRGPTEQVTPVQLPISL